MHSSSGETNRCPSILTDRKMCHSVVRNVFKCKNKLGGWEGFVLQLWWCCSMCHDWTMNVSHVYWYRSGRYHLYNNWINLALYSDRQKVLPFLVDQKHPQMWQIFSRNFDFFLSFSVFRKPPLHLRFRSGLFQFLGHICFDIYRSVLKKLFEMTVQ